MFFCFFVREKENKHNCGWVGGLECLPVIFTALVSGRALSPGRSPRSLSSLGPREYNWGWVGRPLQPTSNWNPKTCHQYLSSNTCRLLTYLPSNNSMIKSVRTCLHFQSGNDPDALVFSFCSRNPEQEAYLTCVLAAGETEQWTRDQGYGHFFYIQKLPPCPHNRLPPHRVIGKQIKFSRTASVIPLWALIRYWLRTCI